MGLLDLFRAPPAEPDVTLTRQSEVNTQSLIEEFWARTYSDASGVWFSPRLIERVWSAARCLQLNAQQIASMPLRFTGAPSAPTPAWVSNPDPVWFPNGIGDAVFAAVDSMYRWGDAFLLVTERYADGFPRSWTVLDASTITVGMTDRGRRTFKAGENELDANDVVQVSRDPRGGLRGTSALSSYGAQMFGALSSADVGRSIVEGGMPPAVLWTAKKITPDQAQTVKSDWALAAAQRRGEPLVIGSDFDKFETLNWSVKDLMLIESQEFNARVIASAFGVPPFMLNLALEGGLTYQNPAMLGEMWWRFELRPSALRLSRALTARMLPSGSFVAFDAHDTFAPLVSETGEPVTQEQLESPVAPASPSQNGSGLLAELRPMTMMGGGV